jgi:hypothetical protein
MGVVMNAEQKRRMLRGMLLSCCSGVLLMGALKLMDREESPVLAERLPDMVKIEWLGPNGAVTKTETVPASSLNFYLRDNSSPIRFCFPREISGKLVYDRCQFLHEA